MLNGKRIDLMPIGFDVGFQVLKTGGLWGCLKKENVGGMGRWAKVEFLMVLH